MTLPSQVLLYDPDHSRAQVFSNTYSYCDLTEQNLSSLYWFQNNLEKSQNKKFQKVPKLSKKNKETQFKSSIDLVKSETNCNDFSLKIKINHIKNKKLGKSSAILLVKSQLEANIE